METAAWLLLAAGMWLYSFRFDGDFPAYLWGPVSWPRAVLVAIVILALAQLAIRSAIARRRAFSAPDTDPGAPGRCGADAAAGGDGRTMRAEAAYAATGAGRGIGGETDGAQAAAAPEADDADEAVDANGQAGARLRVLATFALPLVYLFLLPRTGYFITTPVFLVAYMLVFRERSLKYMLATAALLYLGSLAIFSKLLFVPLPTGNWPGFYDFSNWLLEILHAI